MSGFRFTYTLESHFQSSATSCDVGLHHNVTCYVKSILKISLNLRKERDTQKRHTRGNIMINSHILTTVAETAPLHHYT